MNREKFLTKRKQSTPFKRRQSNQTNVNTSSDSDLPNHRKSQCKRKRKVSYSTPLASQLDYPDVDLRGEQHSKKKKVSYVNYLPSNADSNEADFRELNGASEESDEISDKMDEIVIKPKRVKSKRKPKRISITSSRNNSLDENVAVASSSKRNQRSENSNESEEDSQDGIIDLKTSKINASGISFSNYSVNSGNSGVGTERFESFLQSFRGFFGDNANKDEEDNALGGEADEENQQWNMEEENSSMLGITDDTRNYDSECLDLHNRALIFEGGNDNYSFVNYAINMCQVLMINATSPIQLHGHLQLTLIAGNATVCGYDLQINKPIVLYSQWQTGLYLLEASMHNKVTSRKFSVKSICRTILAHLPHQKPKALIDLLKQSVLTSEAVVIVKELPLPPSLELLKLYSPSAVDFRKQKCGDIVYSTEILDEAHCLQFTINYEAIFCSIVRHIESANKKSSLDFKSEIFEETESSDSEMDYTDEETKKNCRTGCRIFITGRKKTGKSTLLRYLINKFLNSHSEVFYLDTDPGQTEFTPPGVVSLSRITEPVFGPPYTHQLLKPVKMCFTGSISPETSPLTITQSVDYLYEHFSKEYPKSVLLVNTMGWYEGIGEMIIDVIRRIVTPTVEITLHPVPMDLVVDIDEEEGFMHLNVGFDRDTYISTNKGDHRPADLRDFALIAYMGLNDPQFLKSQYLNNRRPYCIHWEDIAVFHFNKRMSYDQYYASLNCSIVALCNVDESFLLVCDDEELPTTVENVHVNECLGFGLVLCSDEAQKIFFVVTPVELHDLERVNVLMTGNILIPRPVFIEQPIWDKELAFTDSCTEGCTPGRKPVRNRISLNLEAQKRAAR